MTRYFLVRLIPEAARSISRRSISDRDGRSGSAFRSSSIVAFNSGVRRIWSVSTCFIPKGIYGIRSVVNIGCVVENVSNVFLVSNVLTNGTQETTSAVGIKPKLDEEFRL